MPTKLRTDTPTGSESYWVTFPSCPATGDESADLWPSRWDDLFVTLVSHWGQFVETLGSRWASGSNPGIAEVIRKLDAIFEREPPTMLSFAEAHPDLMSPAQRLRALSGLDATLLGGVFGVSRITFQQWIAGKTPRPDRLEHLHNVLGLTEELSDRLGGSQTVRTWLLEPIAPGASRPIDLLQQQRYRAFRGAILRVSIDERKVRRPAVSGDRSPLMQTPGRNVPRRLRRTAWTEDYEKQSD